MADLNDSLKDSYIGKVADALQPYSAELKAKGFDPANLIKQLADAGPLIEEAHAEREAADQALAGKVAAEQKLRTDHYTVATGAVSTVEGLLGKTHALTEKLRGLRASLIGNQNAGGSTATPPPPKPNA
jgi:arginine/ornithine N-succinyltransferase beta subunit